MTFRTSIAWYIWWIKGAIVERAGDVKIRFCKGWKRRHDCSVFDSIDTDWRKKCNVKRYSRLLKDKQRERDKAKTQWVREIMDTGKIDVFCTLLKIVPLSFGLYFSSRCEALREVARNHGESAQQVLRDDVEKEDASLWPDFSWLIYSQRVRGKKM